MIKAIVFDAFSTLIVTGNSSVEAAEKILKVNGITHIQPKDFYTVWKRFHRENIENAKEFLTEEASFTLSLERTFNYFKINGNAEKDIEIMLSIIGKRSLYEEVSGVVAELRKQYIVCIGSNTDKAPLMENLERNHLSVDRVYTSEGLRCYKPNKQFYQSILDGLGIAPEEMLFCGDSLTDDVFGPQQLGINTCHINRRNEKSETIKPDYELKSLNGLVELVNNIK